MKMTIKPIALIAVLCTLLSVSCSKINDGNKNGKGPKLEFYALINANTLAKYDASKPDKMLSGMSITGMQAGETMLAIDFRPATGQLYGVGSSSRLYVINTNTGNARAIGSGSFTPALAGDVAAFDFNPTVDRIRLISSGGQNLRLNPETGTVVAVDGALNIGGVMNGNVSSAAYTENKAGATTTVLFDIDVNNDILYKQDPPNAGGLVAVGNLGIDLSGTGEFDISASENIALAVYNAGATPSVFTIDLSTGKAMNVGALAGASSVRGIAIPTHPVAYAVVNGSTLLILNPDSPTGMVSKPITGTVTGEMIVGIDFRPSNGQLYALGNSSRIYTINTANGMATMVGAQFTTLLKGTDFGFDFNPLVDRIRIVSNLGLNLRLHPETAAVTVDLDLTENASVGGAAYTNNFTGTTSTTLFDIDVMADQLLKQDPPNNGTLVAVGSLGLNATAIGGFDIGGTSNNAWAVLTADGKTRIHKINLMNGAASPSPANFEFTGGSITGFAIGLGF